tara:strand:+ start:102210 stop:103796 length:1587 start_codon:yes stop_codon:yes gene_type:complete
MKNRMTLFVTLFLTLQSSLILLAPSAYAEIEQTYFCDDKLGDTPIRQGGRVKPLYVHAVDMMKYLTGKKGYENLSAVQTYCLLSLKGMSLKSDIKLAARVDHVEAQEYFDLPEGQKTILFDDLIERIRDLQIETRRIKEETAYKKAMTKLLNQTGLYQEIIQGNNWLLPAVTGNRTDWIPITSFLREDKILEAKANQAQSPFQKVIFDEVERFDKITDAPYHLEYKYAKARLPIIAMMITFLALITLTIFKKFTATLILAGITIALQLALITIRVLISGRAPITNMYETVMFSGFGALFLSMLIGHFKKEKAFIYVGLMFNACTLMMMNFATGMLSDAISPLVPVLRDNFWLSTHVTTIILSYGALALSWIMANTVLIKSSFGKLTKADEVYYSDLIYTILKYGTIMLGAGIILGGVWADYSWGRFWGWDPKETWSLIAFVIYMAILHGRYTNWIPNSRFIPLVAGAFMSIMMAWFGVNYILASGLHSYGFSEGGAIFLGSFFLAQTLIIIITTLKSNLSKTVVQAHE